MGFEVVPFLSARMTIDRGHLTDVVKRLDKAEIRNVFVVAGDSEPRGDFFDGLQLLRAMSEIDDAPAFIGVPRLPGGTSFHFRRNAVGGALGEAGPTRGTWSPKCVSIPGRSPLSPRPAGREASCFRC